MENIITQLNVITEMLISNVDYGIYLVGFCASIECINIVTGRKLVVLGIVPRSPISLIFGPICSHFIHGSFNHLFFLYFID